LHHIPLLPPSPSPSPPLSHCFQPSPTGQDLFYPPVLWFHRRKKKQEKEKKWHFCLFETWVLSYFTFIFFIALTSCKVDSGTILSLTLIQN
jgi:hypothetical protein